MILELNDKEILDFLMTSDFEEGYTPEELRYLLIKYRYFYRLLNGSYERLKVDTDGKIKKLDEDIESIKISKNEITLELDDKNELINYIKNKKLTFKEKWVGKIIDKKLD